MTPHSLANAYLEANGNLTDALDAAAGADALVLITEWNEFRALSPVRLRDAMVGRVLVDLRNVFDPVAMRQAGFSYHGIGRPAV